MKPVRDSSTPRRRRAPARTPAQQQSAGPRQALLVLGMHRSGTSALAGMLARLGATAPKSLMNPDGNNTRGYWESARIAQLHDQMLKSAGSSWSDWEPFNINWSGTSIGRQFSERLPKLLDEEFGDATLLLIKDPRICRLAPFWFEVLGRLNIEPRVILPIRNPLEVAGSLQRRDNLIPVHSLLIWLRHVLEAERESRGFPRSLVDYDGVLQDWRAQAAKLGRDLSIEWPRWSTKVQAEIDEFLTGEMRHHVAEPEAVSVNAQVNAWVSDAYAALRSLVQGGAPEDAARATLDRVKAEFDRAGATFGMVLRHRELLLETARAEADALKREAQELKKQVEQQARKTAEVQEQLVQRGVQAKADNAALDAKSKQLAQQLTDLQRASEKRAAELQRELAKRDAQQIANATRLGEQAARLQQLQQALTKERESSAARDERISHLREKLREAEQGVASLAMLKDARAKDKELLGAQQQRLEEFKQRIALLESKLQNVDQARQMLAARLEERSAQALRDANLIARNEAMIHALLQKEHQLQQKLEAVAAERLAQKQALTEARASMEKMQAAQVRDQARIGTQKARIAAQDTVAAQQKARIEQQKTRIAQLGVKLTALQHDASRLQAEVTAKGRAIDRRFREIAILTQLVDRLQQAPSQGAPQEGKPGNLKGAPSLAAIRRTLTTGH